MPSPPTDFSTQTLSHLNEYIKFADQKASVLLTGQLAFLGLFVNFLNQTWSGTGTGFQILAAGTIGAHVSRSGIRRMGDLPANRAIWGELAVLGEYQRKVSR